MGSNSVPTRPTIETALQQGPVDVAALDWPALTDCGAEAVFLGRTRIETHPKFGRLLRLEYETYEPMAERLLKDIAAEVVAQHPCRSLRVVHAIGVVLPGAASVVIQAAAPHRDVAFEACHLMIERIKHELPMWKHEIWEHGRTYVEGVPVDNGNGDRE